MPRRRLIAEEWASYAREVMPADASPVQKEETRLAFYSGATALFHTIIKSLSADPEPTDSDLTMMEDLHQELMDYAKSLPK